MYGFRGNFRVVPSGQESSILPACSLEGVRNSRIEKNKGERRQTNMSNGAMRLKVREEGKALEPTQRGKLVISCSSYFLLLLFICGNHGTA